MYRICQGCTKPYGDGFFPGPWPRKFHFVLPDHHGRCVRALLQGWGALLKELSGFGDVVGVHLTFPHHLGNDDCIGLEAPSYSHGYPCVDPVRQHHSCELYESPGFSQISSSQRLDSLHSPSSQKERPLPHSEAQVMSCSPSFSSFSYVAVSDTLRVDEDAQNLVW